MDSLVVPNLCREKAPATNLNDIWNDFGQALNCPLCKLLWRGVDENACTKLAVIELGQKII
jgi:hypothetical protein